MGKFSNYRYLELKDNTSNSHINTRSISIKPPRRLKKVFILLIILALCATYFLGLFAGQTQWFDGLAKSLGYESVYHHAVIIDAGSSGSRVLAYKFRVPFTVFASPSLDLVEEFFEQSKPGLSSYADDPEKANEHDVDMPNARVFADALTAFIDHKIAPIVEYERLPERNGASSGRHSPTLLMQGAETIVQLIKKAEFLTPVEKRRSTPLIVRATAGLRLLPKEKAHQLLFHVSKAISKLGYDVEPKSVEVMDGSDEGIFIWYTVNLLHNLVGGETMAALDLGGGSTQITYELNDRDAANYPPEDRYVVPAGENVTLYTHSYLNLGLLAARYGIFRLEAGDNATNEFTSACVDPIVQREPWTYANKQYFVSGAPRGVAMKRETAYARCHELVRRYTLRTLDWEPQHAPKGSVAAMSYFYDVAADAGIIDVMRGGTGSVAQYRSSAIRACSAANVEQPWACIDLVFIVTLLQDAYKIQDNDAVCLFKKVNGHEVSWALGLAYTTVMNRMAAAAAAA